MSRVLKKYFTILQICIVERLTYRTDFFFGTLMRFLPIVTTIFLWSAIFAGKPESEGPQQIAGLTSGGIIAYYLLTMVSRAFSSMPGLANSIAYDIREGQIKKYLLQPVNMIGFLLVSRASHKLVYYAIAIGPYALVFWLCRGYFADGFPSAFVLTAFLLSLVMAFLIGFFFETLIGLLGFWVLEISSFNFIIITLNYILSGHMFPLDLFPEPIRTIVKWLPFQYMAYFPSWIFLKGDSQPPESLLIQIGVQAIYTVVLALLVAVTFRRGLVRYSAFGG